MTRKEIQDEHLRRMAEPEPYASLRKQMENIEAERERECRQAMYDLQAQELRRQIRKSGNKPCA